MLLGVNIDHSATVRQARYRSHGRDCGNEVEPDPVHFALMAEQAGADGITIHLREDARHIQESDVLRLRASATTRMNLEMACTDAMLAFALKVRPDSVCLVPENRAEITTEGGLDVAGQVDRVASITRKLLADGIAVSLFIDPDAAQIDAALDIGAPFIELHTGAFANAYFGPMRAQELQRLVDGATHASHRGLTVNAGHGINYVNIADIRRIPYLHELNIGHAIISRALFTGIGEAVREMKARMNGC